MAISPPDQRGRALARVFGGITLAQVVGVPLGAWLAYRFGWHSTFWTVAVLAGLSAVVLLYAIPRNVTFQATTLSTIAGALKNFRLMFAVTFTATIMSAVYIVFTFFGPLIEASAGTNPETRTFYLLLSDWCGGWKLHRRLPQRPHWPEEHADPRLHRADGPHAAVLRHPVEPGAVLPC